MCSWKLWLYPVKLPGGRGEVRVGEGGLLLGVTVLEDGPGLVDNQEQSAIEAASAPPTTDEAVIAPRPESGWQQRALPIANQWPSSRRMG